MDPYPLSVCIITTEQDRPFLPAALDSIPGGAEVIVLETAEEGGPSTVLEAVGVRERKGGGVVKGYRWRYPRGEWSFARARNKCASLASRPWILALDSDERMAGHQLEDLTRVLQTAPPNVGGYTLGVGGWTPAPSGKSGQHHVTQQVRLFRNVPVIYWEGRVHELVRPSIERAGYRVLDSVFFLYHEGYEVQPEVLVQKSRRNIGLLCREYLNNPASRTLEYLAGTIQLLRSLEEANKKG